MMVYHIKFWVMILCSLWLGITLIGPGYCLRHIDDVYYKEPGANLVLNGKFAAPTMRGYGDVHPDYDVTFAGYPPLYPGAYAFWLKAFPFSYRSSVAFDAVIRMLLVCWVLFGLPRLIPTVSSVSLALTAMCTCVLGTWGRPDELAMVFGLWGMSWWNRRAGLMAPILGGILFGCCACTSYSALIVLGACYLPIWVHSCALTKDKTGVIKSLLVGASAFAFTSLLVLIPYYLRAGAMQQTHSDGGQLLSGVMQSLHEHSVRPYLELWKSCIRTALFRMPLYALLLGLGGVSFLMPTARLFRPYLVGIFLSCALVAIGMPQQVYYYWFVCPLLIAIIFSCYQWNSWPGVVALMMLIVAANPTVREVLKVASLPPQQRMAFSARVIRERIPFSSRVAGDVRTYYLLAPDYSNLFITDGIFPREEMMTSVRYMVFTSYLSGRKNGMPMPRYWLGDERGRYLLEHFRLVYDNVTEEPPRLWGNILGSESFGYGVAIYMRRDTTEGLR
jgi:hypothetical protein